MNDGETLHDYVSPNLGLGADLHEGVLIRPGFTTDMGIRVATRLLLLSQSPAGTARPLLPFSTHGFTMTAREKGELPWQEE